MWEPLSRLGGSIFLTENDGLALKHKGVVISLVAKHRSNNWHLPNFGFLFPLCKYSIPRSCSVLIILLGALNGLLWAVFCSRQNTLPQVDVDNDDGA